MSAQSRRCVEFGTGTHSIGGVQVEVYMLTGNVAGQAASAFTVGPQTSAISSLRDDTGEDRYGTCARGTISAEEGRNVCAQSGKSPIISFMRALIETHSNVLAWRENRGRAIEAEKIRIRRLGWQRGSNAPAKHTRTSGGPPVASFPTPASSAALEAPHATTPRCRGA